MICSRFVARAALRRGATGGRLFVATLAATTTTTTLLPSTPTNNHINTTPSSHYYHSYALPSQPSASSTSTSSRNGNVPETSISLPDMPLPKVQETRPPSSALSPPPPPPAAQKQQHLSEYPAAQPQQQEQEQEQEQEQRVAAQAQKPIEKKEKSKRQRPKLRPRKAAMTLTSSAVEQLRTLLDQPKPKLIKVGVRNRGCSGLAYHLEYVEKPGPFDEAVEQDGVKVLIDSKALFSIIGSEMDWAEDKLNQRFVFRNPNIKEECGCGESFMV